MARIARVVVPGLPHHVTQHDNHRQETFFVDEDYADYRALIRSKSRFVYCHRNPLTCCSAASQSSNSCPGSKPRDLARK